MLPAMSNRCSTFNHEFTPDAWLRQAHNDLALAQVARDNGFLAQSCDYASQGAEQALKGALLELGIEPPHTQVLNDLVRRLKGLMAIQSRYPLDATPPCDLFDPGDADQALSCAHQVLRIVEALDQGQSSV